MPENNEQLVVVRQRRGERYRRLAILIGLTVSAGVIGFFLGSSQFMARYQAASEGQYTLAEQRDQLQEEVTELRRRAIQAERGQQLDEHSLLEAQRTIHDLEEDLKEKQSQITFYRTVMAPEDLETGFQVFRMDLDPTRNSDRWRYNLVLSQLGDNNQFVSGHVNVELVGYSDGERQVLSFEEVSGDLDESDISFRFRYFQTIDGELIVPDGFEPESIRVIAEAGNERSERSFPWHEKTGEQADVSQVQQ